MTWDVLSGAELRRRAGASDAVARMVVTDDSIAVWCDGDWAAAHPWLPGWADRGITLTTGTPQATQAALDALAAELRRERQPVGWYSVPREQPAPRLPEGWAQVPEPSGDDGCWDMMTATAVLPPDPRHAFVELDDAADADQIKAFNAAHNPHSEGNPGKGYTHLWLGLRDASGALQAVGAWQPLETGLPYLAGIVVDSALRGRGIGAALTSELTRRALAEHPEACLGVDAENAGAIGLYRRLGYVTARHFRTHDVAPPWGKAPTL